MSLLRRALGLVGKKFSTSLGPFVKVSRAFNKEARAAAQQAASAPGATAGGRPGTGENLQLSLEERVQARKISDQKRSDQLGQSAFLSAQEPASSWRSDWLQELAYQAQHGHEHSLGRPVAADPLLLRKVTIHLVDTLFECLDTLAAEFNTLIQHPALRITITKPSETREALGSHRTGERPEQALSYYRGRASSSFWSLSIRGADGLVECFSLPVGEVMLLAQSESASRLKLRLKLEEKEEKGYWTLDRFPVNSEEVRVLARGLFKELVMRSLGDHEVGTDTLSGLLNLEGERLVQAINQLLLDKQNLVQKIINQQEEIQNQISRDLHDAVIADVMMLKRSLSDGGRPPESEIMTVLDRINAQLREICHDLAPRDLTDWGLQTVIEDLLQRVAERTGIDCAFNCDEEIPDLPNAVQLHIYRIVQECLNNIEKYSGASRVALTFQVKDGTLSLTIQDNGRGFSLSDSGSRRTTREGGKGLGSLRERAELIRCFYPARFSVQSEPDRGSRVTLEMKLTGSFAKD